MNTRPGTGALLESFSLRSGTSEASREQSQKTLETREFFVSATLSPQVCFLPSEYKLLSQALLKVTHMAAANPQFCMLVFLLHSQRTAVLLQILIGKGLGLGQVTTLTSAEVCSFFVFKGSTLNPAMHQRWRSLSVPSPVHSQSLTPCVSPNQHLSYKCWLCFSRAQRSLSCQPKTPWPDVAVLLSACTLLWFPLPWSSVLCPIFPFQSLALNSTPAMFLPFSQPESPPLENTRQPQCKINR